jgi:peptide/nickel transport system substrate-binding protein
VASRLVQVALAIVVALGVAACSPGQRGDIEPAASAPAASQTMVIVIRAEPLTVAGKVIASGIGTAQATSQRLFNATLGILDADGAPRPYLADPLPQLDTDMWRVFPDGRMETTHRLRSGATWHDGTPLTAQDFVFAWQVYVAPQIGIASSTPQSLIAEVSAPDSATIVIQWKRPFPNASSLAEDQFPPLPRHVLQETFERAPETLANEPFWTREYVGLGPYRLTRWEPGAFIEGAAFEGHVLGRAKIDRVRIIFISDTSAVLANLLAEEAHFSTDSSIRFQEGMVLQREWSPRNGGAVLMRPGGFRGAWVQLRPDVANPRALLDLRVRKALAHSTNRQDVNDALFEGQGIMAEAPFIPPSVSYYAEVDRAIAKYPYDPRITEQLMADAGIRKGGDGVFASPADGRLHFDVKTLADTQREQEMAVLANGWRRAGFDFGETTLVAARAGDNEARATFPGIFTYSTGAGEYGLANITTSAIGSPENRWIGPNRVGWSNEQFDRLSAAFTDAVAPAERTRYIAEMSRVFTEALPAIPLLFDTATFAHTAALRGVRPAVAETPLAWNVHEWELR